MLFRSDYTTLHCKHSDLIFYCFIFLEKCTISSPLMEFCFTQMAYGTVAPQWHLKYFPTVLAGNANKLILLYCRYLFTLFNVTQVFTCLTCCLTYLFSLIYVLVDRSYPRQGDSNQWNDEDLAQSSQFSTKVG